MKIEHIQFADIHYNPEQNTFETMVAIQDGGAVYVYPVHVHAPLTAGFQLLTRRFMAKAGEMHRSGQYPMRMKRLPDTQQALPPHALAA